MEALNNIAKQFVADTNSDGKIDAAEVVNSLQQLLSDTSGKLNIGSIVDKLKNTDFSETVSSWLGDGKNADFSVDGVSKLFDSEQLSKFASSLNLDIETAKTALAGTIPNLIDQLSSGGNLLDSISEQATKLQAEATEAAESVLAAAEAKGEGILAKIKKLLG